MVDFTNVTVIAALIAATAALLVAIFNFYSTLRNQRELQRHQLEQEKLRDELTKKQREQDARREYEYEARKHLYQQYEPLFFQLVECSDKAHWRIYSLARTANRGDLGPDRVSWLSPESFHYKYYIASTIYKLLSPLVYFKLIQQHLTLVDFALDPCIDEQYTLAKWLYMSFTEGFKLATILPEIMIEYDPDCYEWQEKRKQQPQKYWRQALFEGRLDCAVEALIVPANSEVGRCMSYGEFESAYWDEKTHEKFDVLTDLFLEFHPRTRPILWRLLITQAHLHEALLRAHALHHSTSNDYPKLLIRPIEDPRLYDWRQNQKEASDKEVLTEPFNAARAYLQEVLASSCAF